MWKAYDAVNGTDYSNTDDIQINTIDDYLYMGMKNDVCLECKAIMLNINKGHNEQLMQACKKLDEYSTFIAMVRANLKAGMKLRAAVDKESG